MFTQDYMPLCQMCDACQCENCKYINKKSTKEVNVSPSYQCMKAQIERQASYHLQEQLINEFTFLNVLEEKECKDPITSLSGKTCTSGYYMGGVEECY